MLNAMAGAVVDTPTRCAVFKIDLKGRFVFIDEETEKILGIAPEELFGCSIYDFISADSVRNLENILNCHNRYESFYEAMPLTIRVNDSKLNRYNTVVTLNFISGNPVNYQFILIPPQSIETAIEPNPVSQASIGDELALLSRASDALGVGVVVVNQQLTILLKNETLDRLTASKGELSETDFKTVFKRLNLCHPSNSRVAFSRSVFTETIKSSAENSAEYFLAESGDSLTVIGAPFKLADSTVFIFYFLPGRNIGNNEESITSTSGKLLTSFACIVRPPLKTIDAFARRLRQNQSDRLDEDGRFALDCLNENIKILFGMADGLTEITRFRNTKQKPVKINLN
ncbi:MAG: PAS domain-containing protein, partial [FCB group bacterium]|nr:PAS domain-containing protein [FCB group bacterium]